MKRSDMLDVLKQEFMKYNAAGSKEDHERLATHILYVMELMGMSPPLEPDRRVEDCDLGLSEWEPEEED